MADNIAKGLKIGIDRMCQAASPAGANAAVFAPPKEDLIAESERGRCWSDDTISYREPAMLTQRRPSSTSPCMLACGLARGTGLEAR